MQSAFEAITEQGAQRLALAHPIEQLVGEAHATRGEVDRKQIRRVVARMGQVCIAQQRRGLRLRDRGRVDEAGIVGKRKHRSGLAGRRRQGLLRGRGLQVLDPAVGTHVDAGGVVCAHLGQALGGKRSDPCIKPVRRDIQRADEQAFEGLGIECRQMREGVAEPAQGLEYAVE